MPVVRYSRDKTKKLDKTLTDDIWKIITNHTLSDALDLYLSQANLFNPLSSQKSIKNIFHHDANLTERKP